MAAQRLCKLLNTPNFFIFSRCRSKGLYFVSSFAFLQNIYIILLLENLKCNRKFTGRVDGGHKSSRGSYCSALWRFVPAGVNHYFSNMVSLRSFIGLGGP